VNDATTVTTKWLAADETDRLISSEKVEGTAVYERTGQHIGSIHHVMIDKYTGEVACAEMSFSGFLGISESYHPLPWKALTYDLRLGGYVTDVNRGTLEGTPSYRTSDMPNWSDRAYTWWIDKYSLPPV
jgi:hypothetical protein